MAVDPKKDLRTVTETQRQITVLTDKAQDDLLLAISCIVIAAGSDRSDLLLAGAEEYIRNLAGKLRLASKLARSVPQTASGHVDTGNTASSVPVLEHAETGQGSQPTQD